MATTALLEELEALWPTVNASNSSIEHSIPNPYALITAVVFGSANFPELVPSVWVHAASHTDSNEDKALLARRMRDALFKVGMLTGYSRTINAMLSLHAEMPEEHRAAQFGSERGIDWPERVAGATTVATTDGLLVPGAPQPTLDQIVVHGRSYFGELYGDTASTTQAMLDAAYPDLGYCTNMVGYGLVFGGATHLLSLPENSIVLIAGLIAIDTPRQVGWHLANARRLGITLEQARAVREMAMRASVFAGVTWKDGVPEAS